MKKIHFLIFLLLTSLSSLGQVKISDAGNLGQPHASAILELESNNKGLLIPRVTDTNSVANPTPGLIVFSNADSKMYFRKNGKWTNLTEEINLPALNTAIDAALPKTGGTVTGPLILSGGLQIPTNAGEGRILTSNALGVATWTLPAVSLIRTFFPLQPGAGAANFMIGSNTMADNSLLNINNGVNNLGIGQYALGANVNGVSNIAIGNAALQNNTGNENTAIGRFAMDFNTTGNKNVAIGFASLRRNTTGTNNVAIGNEAMQTNGFTGSFNTAIGFQAGSNLTTGSNNIAIGSNSVLASPTGSNQLTIANTLFGTNINSPTGGNIGIRTNAPTQALDINGQVRIRGGNPGINKVLTSDASGIASWEPIPPNPLPTITTLTRSVETIYSNDNTEVLMNLGSHYSGTYNSSNWRISGNDLTNISGNAKYVKIIYNYGFNGYSGGSITNTFSQYYVGIKLAGNFVANIHRVHSQANTALFENTISGQLEWSGIIPNNQSIQFAIAVDLVSNSFLISNSNTNGRPLMVPNMIIIEY